MANLYDLDYKKDKHKKCTGCIPEKGDLKCIFRGLLATYREAEGLLECPCFECLVKVTCNKQCKERIVYFKNNIEDLMVKCNVHSL